jgi:hypothetical protein
MGIGSLMLGEWCLSSVTGESMPPTHLGLKGGRLVHESWALYGRRRNPSGECNRRSCIRLSCLESKAPMTFISFMLGTCTRGADRAMQAV